MKTIDEVLAYYSETAIPAISTAQVVAGSFPPGILNEIRNGLGHISRTPKLFEQNKKACAEDELNKAYRHFERVSLDCCKVTIEHLATKAEKLISDIEGVNFALTQSHYNEATALRERRIALNIEEGQEPPNGKVEDYKALVNDFDIFCTKLHNEYQGNVGQRRAAIHKKNRWIDHKANFFWAIFGIIGGFALSLYAGKNGSFLNTWLKSFGIL
jgi:hypothetical protein